MMPWLAPIQDNLQFLMGDDKTTLEMYMEKGQIEVEAMTFHKRPINIKCFHSNRRSAKYDST